MSDSFVVPSPFNSVPTNEAFEVVHDVLKKGGT